jgi:16S rRNA (adenine1518-N6/adenine1519-N6)-dimethyltransferase
MEKVKPKKHLGQHFLTDKKIAEKIVKSLKKHKNYNYLLEIGAGTGILTDFLIQEPNFYVVEIDRESIHYLKNKFENIQLLEADFLETTPKDWFQNQDFNENFAIISNFPYNISSQIFFRILEYKNQIDEVVGMLQREVALRLTAKPKTKEYGILSVLLQAFYHLEYLFTVEAGAFHPSPKVRSGVIRLTRNEVKNLGCNEKKFFQIIKQGFNQRRKTLRNALKSLNIPESLKNNPILNKRAEELSVQDFVEITLCFETT